MPELDRQGIAEILDIEVSEVPAVIPPVPAITNNEPAPAGDEPRMTLQVNIIKANSILNLIEQEMVNGNFSARLAEVASLIINSITTAAAQIMVNDTNKESLQIKRDVVELKSKELEIKQRLLSGRQQQEAAGGRDRLVITDRETVLKFLRDEKEKGMKQIVGGSDDEQ